MVGDLRDSLGYMQADAPQLRHCGDAISSTS